MEAAGKGACWDACAAKGCPFVELYDGVCYCQKKCTCMDDIEDNGRITMVPPGFELPVSCCANSPTWHKLKKPNMGCDWVAKRPGKRCKARGREGGGKIKRAQVVCKAACKKQCR